MISVLKYWEGRISDITTLLLEFRLFFLIKALNKLPTVSILNLTWEKFSSSMLSWVFLSKEIDDPTIKLFWVSLSFLSSIVLTSLYKSELDSILVWLFNTWFIKFSAPSGTIRFPSLSNDDWLKLYKDEM